MNQQLYGSLFNQIQELLFTHCPVFIMTRISHCFSWKCNNDETLTKHRMINWMFQPAESRSDLKWVKRSRVVSISWFSDNQDGETHGFRTSHFQRETSCDINQSALTLCPLKGNYAELEGLPNPINSDSKSTKFILRYTFIPAVKGTVDASADQDI